jgi:hypothetical protein
MSNETTDAIRKNLWRQGSIFPVVSHKILSAAISKAVSDDDACIVVTQSCCVVNRDLSAEPTVEILLARKIQKLDKGVLGGKSVRKLHLEISVAGRATAYELLARDRYTIERKTLAEYGPDQERVISQQDLRTVIAWVTARYDREAFPDAFEKRLERVQEKLKKAFEKLEDITEVFIGLAPEDELGDDQPYTIYLVFVMQDELYQAVDSRRKMETAVNEIRSIIHKCKGIVLDSDELRSDADVSLRDLRNLRRWGTFDYVSYRDQAVHQLPQ